MECRKSILPFEVNNAVPESRNDRAYIDLGTGVNIFSLANSNKILSPFRIEEHIRDVILVNLI